MGKKYQAPDVIGDNEVSAVSTLPIPKTKIKGWRCLICGYIWVSKAQRSVVPLPLAEQKPKSCARCRSTYWWLGRRRAKRRGSKFLPRFDE